MMPSKFLYHIYSELPCALYCVHRLNSAPAGCYVHLDVLGDPALVPGDCSPPGLAAASSAASAPSGDFAGSAPASLDPAALHASPAGAFIAQHFFMDDRGQSIWQY